MELNTSKKVNIFKWVIFALLLASSISFIIKTIVDGMLLNDYYWHYKVGEWIIENKTIPTTGIFSWYAIQENLYWFSHEWLSGVLLYLMSFGSKETAIIVSGIISSIFVFVTMYKNKDKIENYWLIYIFYTFYATILIGDYFYPRPHMFSFILLFIELSILYKFLKKPETKTIYLLPLIAIIWANVHGGSSNLIYILPIIFIISSLIDYSIYKLETKKIGKKNTIKLIVVTIISTLSLLINPHGIKILVYPFENMANEFMLDVIEEWRAPDIKTSLGLFTVIAVVFVALILMTTTKKIKLHDFLLFLFFAYLYFRSERFIVMFIISSLFYMYEYAPIQSIEKLYEFPFQIRVAIMTTIISFLIGFIGIWNYLSITNEDDSIVIDSVINQEVIDVINSYPHERLYNYYNFGGELIFNNIDVFIDGRADMYSNNNFEEFYAMSTYSVDSKGNTSQEQYIEKYNFDMFVCSITERINIYLENNPNKYKLIYKNEDLKIYINIERVQ